MQAVTMARVVQSHRFRMQDRQATALAPFCVLKRDAIVQFRFSRFSPWSCRMALSQNRRTLLRHML
jgi:hypothetical protein